MPVRRLVAILASSYRFHLCFPVRTFGYAVGLFCSVLLFGYTVQLPEVHRLPVHRHTDNRVHVQRAF